MDKAFSTVGTLKSFKVGREQEGESKGTGRQRDDFLNNFSSNLK